MLACVLVIGVIVPVAIVLMGGGNSNRIARGTYTLNHVTIGEHTVNLEDREGLVELVTDVATPILTEALGNILDQLLEPTMRLFLGGDIVIGAQDLTKTLVNTVVPLIIRDTQAPYGLFATYEGEFMLSPEEQATRIFELFGHHTVRTNIANELVSIFPESQPMNFIGLAEAILFFLLDLDYIEDNHLDMSLVDLLVHLDVFTRLEADAFITSEDLLNHLFSILLPEITEEAFEDIWTDHALAFQTIATELGDIDWIKDSLFDIFATDIVDTLVIFRSLMENALVLDMLVDVLYISFTLIPDFDVNHLDTTKADAFFTFVADEFIPIVLDALDDVANTTTDVVDSLVNGLLDVIVALGDSAIIDFLFLAIPEVKEILPMVLEIINEIPELFKGIIDLAGEMVQLNFGNSNVFGIQVDILEDMLGEDVTDLLLSNVFYTLVNIGGTRNQVIITETFTDEDNHTAILSPLGFFGVAIAGALNELVPSFEHLGAADIFNILSQAIQLQVIYDSRTNIISFEAIVNIDGILDMFEIDLGFNFDVEIELGLHFTR